MSKAKLNKTQTKQVVRDILAGASWVSVAYEFPFGYQTLRNIIADNLHLHVAPKKSGRRRTKRHAK